ncbi:MAG TPA: EAL domain-containing protein [Xanthobacteraceae bacterium]|jgi:diguanylate cyclase (GGDEF)-like protein|nr:EAL domain-containing protein [Xanthobacteraceae bacterium]
MREFWQRHQWGDRWLAAVGGLMALAAVVLVGVAILVAHRVDTDSIEREVATVRNGVASKMARMRSDLRALSRWDETVPQGVSRSDASWIHRNFGRRMHETSGYDQTYILKGENVPVYASINGRLADKNIYEVVEENIRPIIAEVRDTYKLRRLNNVIHTEATDIAPSPEPVSRVIFTRIDQRPALVGVVAVSTQNEAADNDTPAIAINVRFTEGRFLQDLGKNYSAENIAVRDSRAQPDEASMPLPLYGDGGKNRPAWLVWTPKTPGTAMLRQLLPALVGIVLFLGFMGAMVLRQARLASEELKNSERRAKELAFRDTLTGLGNRAQLLEILAESLETLKPDRKLALLFIDIDGFKDINDTLGHHVGDELLTVAAWRLAAIKNSLAAVRLGGDEFALLLPLDSHDEIGVISRHILENLRQQTPAGDHVLTVSASIGVAIAPEHALDAETLLRRADIALYRARTEGRGTLRMFDPGYEDALHKRGKMERELAAALTNEELVVRYQPQLSADGERVVGVEALVRWDHPERGVVPPNEFVPTAEHSGLIVRLDEWVLRRACQEAQRWPDVSLAVNLSPSNFHSSDMVARLTRVLDETGFNPRRLEIEITEGTLLNATPEVLGQLAEMRQMGIRIVLDDFGTGYSSLGYLRSFPVDKIKIDKSFVQNLGVTEESAAIIECVARLGRAIGLTVTAEGVETKEQHRFVRAAGCHQLQGFLFSKAVPADQLSEMLNPTKRDKLIRLATSKV